MRHDSGRGLTNWLPSSTFSERSQAFRSGSVGDQALCACALCGQPPESSIHE